MHYVVPLSDTFSPLKSETWRCAHWASQNHKHSELHIIGYFNTFFPRSGYNQLNELRSSRAQFRLLRDRITLPLQWCAKWTKTINRARGFGKQNKKSSSRHAITINHRCAFKKFSFIFIDRSREPFSRLRNEQLKKPNHRQNHSSVYSRHHPYSHKTESDVVGGLVMCVFVVVFYFNFFLHDHHRRCQFSPRQRRKKLAWFSPNVFRPTLNLWELISGGMSRPPAKSFASFQKRQRF